MSNSRFMRAGAREAVQTPDPRELLRQAQAAAAVAAQAAQDAAAAAARGQVGVDTARAALAVHDDVDARVAAHNASLLRAGDPAGRAVLPADLVEARSDQAAARLALADAVAAHALVATEARTAAAAAEQATVAVQVAVIAVMGQDAAAMARLARELEARTGELRASLSEFANGWSFEDRKLNPVPSDVGNLLNEPSHGPILQSTGWDHRRPAASWSDYRRRLTADLTATFEPAP